MAEAAVDALGLGKSGGTDFLGVSYSSVDYVGHTFGPRSREIQDVLVRLDKDLGELFAHPGQKVGARELCGGVERGSWRGSDSRGHAENWRGRGSAEPAGIEGAHRKGAGAVSITPSRRWRACPGMKFIFRREFMGRLQADPAAMNAVLDGDHRHAGRCGCLSRGRFEQREHTPISPLRRAAVVELFRRTQRGLVCAAEAVLVDGGSPNGKKRAQRAQGTGHLIIMISVCRYF